MGDVTLTEGSQLTLTDQSKLTLTDKSKLTLTEDSELKVTQVQNISPVAVHIKEANHIDPISIDELHVSEVRNIEPICVERFNVTNLPMVNISLRQLPPVEMNIRRLPPFSIGSYQNFNVPSNYTVRARFLGIEFLRIHLNGQTMIMPKERFRREQGRTKNRSFPVTAIAGNPAIPSKRHEMATEASHPNFQRQSQSISSAHRATGFSGNPMSHKRMNKDVISRETGTAQAGKSQISFGLPSTGYSLFEKNRKQTYGSSSISFGG